MAARAVFDHACIVTFMHQSDKAGAVQKLRFKVENWNDTRWRRPQDCFTIHDIKCSFRVSFLLFFSSFVIFNSFSLKRKQYLVSLTFFHKTFFNGTVIEGEIKTEAKLHIMLRACKEFLSQLRRQNSKYVVVWKIFLSDRHFPFPFSSPSWPSEVERYGDDRIWLNALCIWE